MLIAISIIAAPLPVYSQDINGGTYMEGLMQGQMMAEGNAGWILGGFCCGIFGIGGAYLIEPSPPMHMLMGKSTEYVMGKSPFILHHTLQLFYLFFRTW